LVKLPVALSGGSRLNCEPLAGAMLSTVALIAIPGKVSIRISARWPIATWVSWVALVQMAVSDQVRWRAKRAEVSDGQAEERGAAVQVSTLRPRHRHPVRALVSSLQAEPA